MQRFILLFAAASLCLHACSPKLTRQQGEKLYSNNNLSAPDYSKLAYWAAHPFKHDPSDSVPLPLRNSTTKDSAVDVFFLHPTTLTSRSDTAWNADVDDASLNNKTDRSTILYQASVFNECRVFAPRYRQANLKAYYTSDTVAAAKAFALAYEDIKNAFQFYLDHYNQGRPIIIASHSQGSTHAQRLLKDFFEKGPLKNRLVVAYVIGMYIPAGYFTELKMCKDAHQTGCITGWRTFRRGYVPDFVMKEHHSGLVANPLTWTTTEEYAPDTLNKGGVISNFSKLHVGIADAQIHDDILWIGRPHIPGSFLLRMKNYHVGDINLFYVNIRQNIRERISAFWKG